MLKKKLVALSVLFLSLVVLCSCSSIEKPQDDQVFINNLSKALEARWKNANVDTSQLDISSYRNYLKTKCVQAELDFLGSYEDYTFKDSHLADLAQQYFDALDQQYKGADYYGIDDMKYDELFNKDGYNVRALVLKELAEDYGLTVSDAYQADLDDFISAGGVIEEENTLKDDVQSILDSLKFKKTSEVDSWHTYTATIENTTDTTFEYFSINIDLVDEEGVTVEQDYCEIDNWVPGSKNEIEFSTDVSFSTMNYTADYPE